MATLQPVRKLTIIAKDPGLRMGTNGPMVFAQVDVPAEILGPGPTGYRIKVVDYNATERRAYAARQRYQIGDTLLDPFAPAEGEVLSDPDYQSRVIDNPNFHAQNCYAIAMRTLGLFERALGRRVSWSSGGHQLHIAPHAFALANAFYSEPDRSLMFGYFFDDKGKPVFTALSHDVVAHETTHAVLDGLRSRYTEPSGPDQAAFHEGFADIVAILSIFSLPEVVAAGLGVDVKVPGPGDPMAFISVDKVTSEAIRKSILLGIGAEIGMASGGGRGALRQSVELEPRADILDEPAMAEAHNRGEVVVAAMTRAFVELWTMRIARLGTFGRRGYNLSAVVEEGAKAAAQLLQMSIRAIDYCPPTDLDFGQFLTSLLTADRELVPDDSRFGYRTLVRKSFADFGIVPPADRTDAEGCWLYFAKGEELKYSRSNAEALTRDVNECFRFLWENRDALGITERGYTQVVSLDTSLRIDPDGIPFRETICQYIQLGHFFGSELMAICKINPLPDGFTTKSSVDLFGGGVVVFDQYGRVKYHIGNELIGESRQKRRLEYLRDTGQLRAPRGDERNRFANLHLARIGG
ncbi:hypothetical protein OHD62_31080 [Mesorhizobium sp. YC-39]|uniref:hypothetical protein n=1 Tax=unclassified Mesorhizobium TaxID=325217 RepID=UPI0021E84B10|nr:MULTISPECIES: hypothetical protein [unclassified Mesorhizobium]MCV3211110.1 hypothetical protein [Mesorhizobium sp. YC-2]MCV3232835.1 hypothetical protein [Mesorhizobium sp. YC-39]